ncbi:hypothetical protein ACFWOB_27545 [Streptomyces sp. NPDC058420]|uniref:hypothetical protein n=1 Tax=Streptomyces sp. NPDC058420 TaxID=3346489 RepID=UPI00364ACB2E
MAIPSLQDGIDKAGSPIGLLWQPNAEPWTPEVVDREYVGWRQEQAAWHEGVALLNLSHHMYDMWIEGPDATRVLAEYGANDFEKWSPPAYGDSSAPNTSSPAPPSSTSASTAPPTA